MATTIYRHRRLDTNEVFYIGIGRSPRRPYRKDGRSNFWNKVVNKTDYVVEIIAENLSWEDACELEIFLISLYGRKNLGLGPLVNLTDGGEGVLGNKHMVGRFGDKHPAFGRKHTDEWKAKRKTWVAGKGFKKNGSLNGMSKKIIDTETGQIFDSITEASDYVKIKRTTLNAMLKGQNKNKTNLKYLT